MKPQSLHSDQLKVMGISVDQVRTLSPLQCLCFSTDAFFARVGQPIPVKQLDETPGDFKNRVLDTIREVLKTMGQMENANFGNPEYQDIREILMQNPLTRGLYTLVGATNIDTNTSNPFSQSSTKTTIRTREYFLVNICYLLNHVCMAVSYSERFRSLLNRYAGKGFYIPRFLKEKLQSVRSSTCGNNIITPVMQSFPQELLESADLVQTLLDTDYLVSEEGFAKLLNLFVQLNSFSNNYIEFVEYSEAIPMFSGTTTTSTAVTVSEPKTRQVQVQYTVRGENDEQVIKSYVTTFTWYEGYYLHPHNSYGQMPDSVQTVDAYLYQQKLIKESTGQSFDLSEICVKHVVSLSSASMDKYFTERMTKLHNGNGYKKQQETQLKDGKEPQEPAPKVEQQQQQQSAQQGAAPKQQLGKPQQQGGRGGRGGGRGRSRAQNAPGTFSKNFGGLYNNSFSFSRDYYYREFMSMIQDLFKFISQQKYSSRRSFAY